MDSEWETHQRNEKTGEARLVWNQQDQDVNLMKFPTKFGGNYKEMEKVAVRGT